MGQMARYWYNIPIPGREWCWLPCTADQAALYHVLDAVEGVRPRIFLGSEGELQAMLRHRWRYHLDLTAREQGSWWEGAAALRRLTPQPAPAQRFHRPRPRRLRPSPVAAASSH